MGISSSEGTELWLLRGFYDHHSKPLLILHQGFKRRILNPLRDTRRSLHRGLNQRELSAPARTTPLAPHYHRWHWADPSSNIPRQTKSGLISLQPSIKGSSALWSSHLLLQALCEMPQEQQLPKNPAQRQTIPRLWKTIPWRRSKQKHPLVTAPKMGRWGCWTWLIARSIPQIPPLKGSSAPGSGYHTWKSQVGAREWLKEQGKSSLFPRNRACFVPAAGFWPWGSPPQLPVMISSLITMARNWTTGLFLWASPALCQLFIWIF